MKAENILRAILLASLFLFSSYMYYYLKSNSLTLLSLFEIYPMAINLDFVLFVNIKTILCLGILPLYYYVSKNSDFILLSFMSTLLFIVQTPWLVLSLLLVLLHIDKKAERVAILSLITVCMLYVVFVLFQLDLNFLCIIILTFYLLFLQKTFLSDFVVMLSLIFFYESEAFLFPLYLLVFSIYLLKTLVVENSADIVRAVIFSLAIFSSTYELIPLLLIFLIYFYFFDKVKRLTNFPFNTLSIAILIVTSAYNSTYVLYLSMSFILAALSEQRIRNA